MLTVTKYNIEIQKCRLKFTVQSFKYMLFPSDPRKQSIIVQMKLVAVMIAMKYFNIHVLYITCYIIIHIEIMEI